MRMKQASILVPHRIPYRKFLLVSQWTLTGNKLEIFMETGEVIESAFEA